MITQSKLKYTTREIRKTPKALKGRFWRFCGCFELQELLTGHPGHELEGPEHPDGPQRLEVDALLLGIPGLGLGLAPCRGDDRDEPEEVTTTRH